MIALFTVVYCICIWLCFVKLKIKPSPTSIAVATVIGVVAIGMIVIGWRFSAPSSSNLVVARYTVQIVPQVKGPVTKIHAEPNVPLKKGVDILFEIQKDIYQNTLNQTAGSLQAARKNVEQLDAGIRVAQAAIKKSEASLEAASAELEVARSIDEQDPSAIARIKVTQLSQQFEAAKAAVEQAVAGEEQAVAGLASGKETVISLEAQLANAQFDVDQCTVYAPADGFVTNWQVREGTMAVSLPFAPLGTFIDTSRTTLIANFSQNVCKNVKPGQPAEFSLKTRPGEVFTGKVVTIIQATGEGQFVTTGEFGSAANLESEGHFIVKFEMDDEEVASSLAMGTAGTVVVYTDKGKALHVISKVVVRMNAWAYYLNPF